MLELDQHNAFPVHLANHLAELIGGFDSLRKQFPFFHSFAFKNRQWRAHIASYYDLLESDVKKLTLSALYPNSALAPRGRCDKLPTLDALHSEMMQVTSLLEQRSPKRWQRRRLIGRQGPESHQAARRSSKVGPSI